MRLVFKCFYVLFLLNGIASAIIPPNKAVVDHLLHKNRVLTCKSEYCIRALGYTLLRNHRAVKFKMLRKPLRIARRRRKHQDSTHTPAKVPFSRGAKKHPDNLGLHGKDRKNVKKFHSKVAKKEMGKKSADLAQIKHLAHTEGSKDPKMHMTSNLWNKNNKRIKSTYGTPPKKGDLHHLYTGSKPLPKLIPTPSLKRG
ncbi:hypothetical protein BDQ17DRAFT_1372381, partial [Cyathus striatus]